MSVHACVDFTPSGYYLIILVRGLVRGSGDDEGRAGFVNQNRVDLVNDAKVEGGIRPQDQFRSSLEGWIEYFNGGATRPTASEISYSNNIAYRCKVIPEIVKPKLAVGDVCDIIMVCNTSLVWLQL